MDKKIISAAGFFGMTAVILGAFGAHALKKLLTIDQLTSFETGVKYQMYHALFLLFLGLSSQISYKIKKTIFILIVSGIVCFSGSIYLLSTTAITNVNFKSIGFITPIGGLLLIVAWGILMIHFLKKKA
ncbi:DUF423 domain-containing protein [Flavobacterium sp.]|uniref:DUF423 domain-containing protein n=1 Tax=Flavobacterium sp. TaxID=239 RepID=UPI002B4B110B|nr:DUF423 domain-containing protein [Flavobacterium sp.]HLP63517.1 DUF423 domain-containing protein [Flavobacterium sp.]